MIKRIGIIGAVCAITLFLGSFSAYATAGDDMPVVEDQPLTEADIAEMEAEQSERLTQAQQALITLGYLEGRADGISGPRTQAAIRAFQRDHGLNETGELDDGTWQAIDKAADAVADVERVQQRLIDLGYMRGRADGIFGEHTRSALRTFQAFQGLEPTGTPDDVTRERLFSDGMLALPDRLSSGDSGDGVAQLQQKLIQYGFLSGEADGKYGRKTVAAVKRVQNHLIRQGVDGNLGIAETGEATPMTLALLYADDFTTYVSDIAPGEEGEEVARVERRLAQLGYMDAEADETFDDYAVSAARAFQKSACIAVGSYGRSFFDALFEEDAPVAEHFVPHDIHLGDRGTAVREVEEAMIRCGMTIKPASGEFNDSLSEAIERACDYLESLNSPQSALFSDPECLTVGAQQLLVDGLLEYNPDARNTMNSRMTSRVQRRLHTLFYLSKHQIDGKLGNVTRKALEEFQETNGLPVTGEADAESLKRLFSEDAISKRYPYRVEVDISRQRVFVHQLGEDGEYELVQTFVCSTGLGNTTPRGIYLNGFPVSVWHHFEKFNCWARYTFEIEGDIMFHSVLYSEQDVDTLREGSVYALGSKASHGCVRLAVKDAKWLFEHCKRGSLVILIY